MPSPVRDEAIRQGTTMWPQQIFDPGDYPYSILKTSQNTKLTSGNPNKRIRAGKWAGMKMKTITLVERETCPDSCHWKGAVNEQGEVKGGGCYMNNMRNAPRLKYTPALMPRVGNEITDYLDKHEEGVVVRWQVGGDAPDVKYVEDWGELGRAYPNLGQYGYSHWHPVTPIGDAIRKLNRESDWGQFSLRFSDWDGPDPSYNGWFGAIQDAPSVICPFQLGQVADCASCGLCWNSEINVLDIHHSVQRNMNMAKRRLANGS